MSLKKLMVKHWWQMAEADVEVVMKSIHDPSCVYLCQHLTTEGINVMELAMENLRGGPSSESCPRGAEDRGLEINCDVLQSPVRGQCSHVVICSQHVIPGQDH